MAEQIEVEYPKAKLSRRFFAMVVDILFFVFSTILLFTVANVSMNATPYFKSQAANLVEIKASSGLYTNDDVIITTYINDTSFETAEAKKDYLSNKINDFYHNDTFFTTEQSNEAIKKYDERRKNATVGASKLFVIVDGEIKENSVNPNDLVNFYSTEVNDYAVGYLSNNQTYLSLIHFTFYAFLIEIAITSTFNFVIFYLVFPLTFLKRGRQTLGMKIYNISLISVHATNVSTGKYIGRFFFMLVFFFYLDIFAFLIPAIVSISMTFLSKTNSSLANYVFNDYMVDTTNKKIYYDAFERNMAEERLKKASIENKDFIIK